jgi:hypothetical protein
LLTPYGTISLVANIDESQAVTKHRIYKKIVSKQVILLSTHVETGIMSIGLFAHYDQQMQPQDTQTSTTDNALQRNTCI